MYGREGPRPNPEIEYMPVENLCIGPGSRWALIFLNAGTKPLGAAGGPAGLQPGGNRLRRGRERFLDHA